MKIEKIITDADLTSTGEMVVEKVNEIISKVNELVEMNSPAQRNGALSGKKEECARCEFNKLPGEYTLPFNYEIPHSCKEDKKEEPKSTLKKEILSIILPKGANKEMWSIQSEIVISLFKDTLLKEVKKAEPLRLQGESTDFTQGQEWAMTQIKQIIQNL